MRFNLLVILFSEVLICCGCSLFLHDIGDEGEPCRDNGLCNSDLVCELGVCCVPAVTKQCGNDGNIHEFSSCGNEGKVATTCSPCESCSNTSSSTAECNKKSDGSTCDDGNACTHSDLCSGGGICSGTVYSCADDGNPCTDDVCLGDGKCDYIANTVSCDDGLVCNGEDRCTDGSCEHSGSPCGLFAACEESTSACVPLQISAGRSHACGIATAGRTYCWGKDDEGQLGNGPGAPNTCTVDANSFPCSQSPVLVDTSGIRFTAITAGGWHTCGLDLDGRAYCWGLDHNGQLGNGSGQIDSQVPGLVDVSGLTPSVSFAMITAGTEYTCGLVTDGRAYCWGSNVSGELGIDDTRDYSDFPVLVKVSGFNPPIVFKEITAGWSHVCGLATDGRAFCWGSDYSGQVGDGGGNLFSVTSPVQVDGGGVLFASLAAGGSHTCGIDTDGRAFCWGSDGMGQLGNGSGGNSTVPMLVDVSGISPPATFQALAAGVLHTCGLATDGRVFCWGASWANAPQLVNLSGISPVVLFRSLAAGDRYTCGLTDDGRAFCWGSDDYGALGNGGGSVDSQVPVPVDVSGIP